VAATAAHGVSWCRAERGAPMRLQRAVFVVVSRETVDPAIRDRPPCRWDRTGWNGTGSIGRGSGLILRSGLRCFGSVAEAGKFGGGAFNQSSAFSAAPSLNLLLSREGILDHAILLDAEQVHWSRVRVYTVPSPTAC
jgi:hypothetical protein